MAGSESGVEAAVDKAVDVAGSSPSQETSYDPLTRYTRLVDRDGVRAFIRIPNPHDQDKIRTKALAARTRMVRQCKDKDSDVYMMIEAKIEPVLQETDEALRTFLVSQHVNECVSQATVLIRTADAEKFPQYAEFSAIDEQLRVVDENLASENPDEDELRVARNILDAYSVALKEAVHELLEPYELKYEALERDELLESCFRLFAKMECDDAFMSAYNEWTMFYGTRKHDDISQQYWPSFKDMTSESLEVIEVIAEEFLQLELESGGDSKKLPAMTSSSISSG